MLHHDKLAKAEPQHAFVSSQKFQDSLKEISEKTDDGQSAEEEDDRGKDNPQPTRPTLTVKQDRQ